MEECRIRNGIGANCASTSRSARVAAFALRPARDRRSWRGLEGGRVSVMTDGRMPDQKRDRGQLRIDEQECKGCGLCIEACPPKVIAMSERLNHYGYRTALYGGAGCTGCRICFMVCPEPGAITVYRLVSTHQVEARAAKT